MEHGKPSRTAMGTAIYRALHQIFDEGDIFPDPLAISITGMTEKQISFGARLGINDPELRFFFASRSALVEEFLLEALKRRGVKQLVVLGAGLDTIAYRDPFEQQLRVFEVDFPSTQAWKVGLLDKAGIELPPFASLIPVDLEEPDLPEALASCGFDPTVKSFFSVLGTVQYLNRLAVKKLLRTVARLPGGAEIVFDSCEPPQQLSVKERFLRIGSLAFKGLSRQEKVASWFTPESLLAELHGAGFEHCEIYNFSRLMSHFHSKRPVTELLRLRRDVPARGIRRSYVAIARTKAH
jgi:methyltransferase (TIGR00027 family)